MMSTTEKKVSREAIEYFERQGISKNTLFLSLIRKEIMQLENEKSLRPALQNREFPESHGPPPEGPKPRELLLTSKPKSTEEREEKEIHSGATGRDPALSCEMIRDHVIATLRQVSMIYPDCPENTIERMMENKRNLEPATVEFWARYGVPKHCLYQAIIRREIAETERRMSAGEKPKLSSGRRQLNPLLSTSSQDTSGSQTEVTLAEQGTQTEDIMVSVSTQTEAYTNTSTAETASPKRQGLKKRVFKEVMRQLHKARRFIERLGLRQVYF